MKFSTRLYIFLYSLGTRNPKIGNLVKRWQLFRRIKESILYLGGFPNTVSGMVKFENLDFYFEAPTKIFVKAEKTGIEARITRFALSQLKPGSIAIDVGANYGFITLAMAKQVAPYGKIVSFEPMPEIYTVLQNSINQNHLEKSCVAINKFAGREINTQFTTVDKVIKELNITAVDFIKIDVDGTDFNVLQGCRNTLDRFHPPIVIEMGANQQEIHDLLLSIGYKHFMGMNGETTNPPQFPPNMFASMVPLFIPPRGFLK